MALWNSALALSTFVRKLGSACRRGKMHGRVEVELSFCYRLRWLSEIGILGGFRLEEDYMTNRESDQNGRIRARDVVLVVFLSGHITAIATLFANHSR
jgi:hypothetical protein